MGVPPSRRDASLSLVLTCRQPGYLLHCLTVFCWALMRLIWPLHISRHNLYSARRFFCASFRPIGQVLAGLAAPPSLAGISRLGLSAWLLARYAFLTFFQSALRGLARLPCLSSWSMHSRVRSVGAVSPGVHLLSACLFPRRQFACLLGFRGFHVPVSSSTISLSARLCFWPGEVVRYSAAPMLITALMTSIFFILFEGRFAWSLGALFCLFAASLADSL